jgi:hypothetical protein
MSNERKNALHIACYQPSEVLFFKSHLYLHLYKMYTAVEYEVGTPLPSFIGFLSNIWPQTLPKFITSL